MIKLFSKKDDSARAEDTKESVKVSATEKKTVKAQNEQDSLAKKTETTNVVNAKEDIASILTRPRMTEKATLGIEQKVYAFNVAPSANKKQIREAIKLVYKVTPRKINVVTITKKGVRNARTGIQGVKGGGKKAYVYLKKNDSITLM